MDDKRRLGITDKLNDKSRLSENGECTMWTRSSKGRRVRYGVMCVNVSFMAVCAPISFTEGSCKPRSPGDFTFTRRW